MGNLGGHDLPALVEAFDKAAKHDRPTCFICYTDQGLGLALAGHKDNHAGMMTPAQMDQLRESMSMRPGHEWDTFEGLATSAERTAGLPRPRAVRARKSRAAISAPHVEVPANLPITIQPTMSTQSGFGALLNELGRGDSDFVKRIVTTSPDVTVSTNLGAVGEPAQPVRARRRWPTRSRASASPRPSTGNSRRSGQHIELGIAENNLFIVLSALGLSHSINGERLFPIGTLYDPFIARGLDALNYACYQEARFILVATPSGITLAGEGGAHQSIGTPLIGMAQDGLAAFEPAYVDELAAIMAWSFDYIQKDGEARAVRAQLAARRDRRLGLSAAFHAPDRADQAHRHAGAAAGDHRRRLLDAKARAECQVVVAYTGAVAPEAIEAVGLMGEDRRDVGLLAVTSADRLNAGWTAAQRARERGLVHARSHIERLLADVPPHCGIVTVLRRASRDARLARRDPWPSHARARRRAFRPDRLDRGSLSALRHRRECDRRRRGGDRAGTADPLSQGAAVAARHANPKSTRGQQQDQAAIR